MYIEVKNLSKKIKDQIVLDEINVSIEKGKSYGFVGRNGCGKTMLFRAICGFMKVDNGTVNVDGYMIGKDRDFIDNAGVIVGETTFLSGLSGYENLLALAQIRNTISNEDINIALKKVNLTDAKDKKYRKYSMGMKQRLRIAQAIMEKPEILVLDEPFNGLDKNGVEEIRNLLIEYKKEGKTILLTSHNEEDISAICDQVIEMENGRIVA